MGALPHLYYEQGIKVERGETISAEAMVKCTSYTSGTFYLELRYEMLVFALDKDVLEEQTDDFVALQVSTIVPVGCTNITVRWGFENASEDDTCAYFDKIRAFRGSAVRLTE